MTAWLIAGQPMVRMDIMTKEERKPPASQLPRSSERERNEAPFRTASR